VRAGTTPATSVHDVSRARFEPGADGVLILRGPPDRGPVAVAAETAAVLRVIESSPHDPLWQPLSLDAPGFLESCETSPSCICEAMLQRGPHPDRFRI
jgi:hypothetical protein